MRAPSSVIDSDEVFDARSAPAAAAGAASRKSLDHEITSGAGFAHACGGTEGRQR
jgi:hypothetical protein